MDIKLEKKPWYIRYRYYLAGGVAFLAFLIYVVTLSLGPSKLRIEQRQHTDSRSQEQQILWNM